MTTSVWLFIGFLWACIQIILLLLIRPKLDGYGLTKVEVIAVSLVSILIWPISILVWVLAGIYKLTAWVLEKLSIFMMGGD